VEQKVVTVSRTNGTGFRVVEGDEWLNISKYAKPAPAMPEVGQRVRVSLDKSGYVRAIEPGEELPAKPEIPAGVSASAGTPPCKDTVISRLAVLNTATAILSSGGRQADGTAVMALAEKLEAWAHR
jgi:hypothetical protein